MNQNNVIFPSLDNNEAPLNGAFDLSSDMAGMSVEMQNMMPDVNLLPLYCLNLKIEQDNINRKIERLTTYLKSKGLDYE